MSDSERRHGYAYNRVLIETERVLDPQFDDAVVFLSGAQLEMLRNVTQYLNRQDTYVSEQFLGYYLAPTTEDYDDILEIVADLEEALMGNPNVIWGYADNWLSRTNELSTGETFTITETVPVPAGYVYEVNFIFAYHTGDSACACDVIINVGGADPRVYTNAALAPTTFVMLPVHLKLVEDQYIQFRATYLTTGKLAILAVLGSKMVIPE